MARLWSCGFELQSVLNGVEWDTTTGSPTINTTTKRSGAAALRCNPSSATAFITHRVDSASARNNLRLRAYIYINSLPSSIITILSLYSTAYAADDAYIRLNSNGTLELWCGYGPAQIGSDSDPLETGKWYRIEIKLDDKVDPIECILTAYIDGVQFATGGGGAGDAFCDTVRLGVIDSNSCDLYFDDVAINDSSNSYQTDLPGAGSILHLRPNAAGDSLPTAGTYADVDEITPDDASSYIELDVNSSTIGDFNIDDWPGASGDVITLVQVGHRERAETAASESKVMRIKSQSGGTVVEGAAKTHNDITWKTNGDTLPLVYTLTSYTDPQGGGSWTPALLDTAQIGVRSVDATPDIWVSTLWALVEYVPAGGTTYQEDLTSIATSVSSIEDVQNFIQVLDSVIQSQSTLIDLQNYLHILDSLIQSQSTLADLQVYAETLQTLIQSESTESDAKAYVEDLQSTIASISALTAIQNYVHVLDSAAQSVSALSDIQNYIDIVMSTAQSISSIADFKIYMEILDSIATSVSTISDTITLVESLETQIQSEATLIDIQHYFETLLTTIVSEASIIDALAGQYETTLPFYLASKKEFQFGKAIESFYTGKSVPQFIIKEGESFYMGKPVPQFIVEKRYGATA